MLNEDPSGEVRKYRPVKENITPSHSNFRGIIFSNIIENMGTNITNKPVIKADLDAVVNTRPYVWAPNPVPNKTPKTTPAFIVSASNAINVFLKTMSKINEAIRNLNARNRKGVVNERAIFTAINDDPQINVIPKRYKSALNLDGVFEKLSVIK